MDKSSLRTVPGVFYDLIVYYGSSLFVTAIVIGTSVESNKLFEYMKGLGLSEKTVLSILLVSLCYVYGQFASTFSSYFVKKPISFIVRKLKPRDMSDYFFDYFNTSMDFPFLESANKSLRGNYWTFVYFIKLYHPDVADDLLKRYARCKLARVNSFNFLLLAVASMISYMLKKLGHPVHLFEVYFPEYTWSVIFAFLSLVFAYEFYQRQCWFGDIVIKIYGAVDRWLSSGGSRE